MVTLPVKEQQTKSSRFQCIPAEIERDKTKDEEDDPIEVTSPKGIHKYLEIGLIKDPMFIMMALTVMAMSTGVPHVLFFLPAHTHSMGFDPDSPSYLLAICSICDLLGRIALSTFIDSEFIPKHICYASAILISGTSVLLLPLISGTGSFIPTAIVMCCYGIGTGSWFLMVPLLLAEYLGVEKIASSYGLVRLFQSGANLTGPLVAGTLKDYYGSYDYAFYFMGTVMICGSFVAFMKPIFKK